MTRWIQCSILAACTLILSTTVAVRPVCGDMLTGSYMLPPAGDSKVLPFSGGQFDPNAITMGICFPEDLIVNVSGYFIGNPFVMITLDGNTPEFRINCLGTGEAIFSLVAPPPPGMANVDFNNFPDPSGEFSAEVNLMSDPTGLFGSFADALLIISYSGLLLDPNGDGRATWPAQPGVPVNIRFALDAIPEPASLALAVCGLIGLTGMGWLRRRGRCTTYWPVRS